MTQQKPTDLEYETFPYLPYSPDLSPINCRFFKHQETFFRPKTFRPKQEVKYI